MRPVFSMTGLAQGLAKDTGYGIEVHRFVQERSVVEDPSAGAALGIAGDLAALEQDVGAADFQSR